MVNALTVEKKLLTELHTANAAILLLSAKRAVRVLARGLADD